MSRAEAEVCPKDTDAEWLSVEAEIDALKKQVAVLRVEAIEHEVKRGRPRSNTEQDAKIEEYLETETAFTAKVSKDRAQATAKHQLPPAAEQGVPATRDWPQAPVWPARAPAPQAHTQMTTNESAAVRLARVHNEQAEAAGPSRDQALAPAREQSPPKSEDFPPLPASSVDQTPERSNQAGQSFTSPATESPESPAARLAKKHAEQEAAEKAARDRPQTSPRQPSPPKLSEYSEYPALGSVKSADVLKSKVAHPAREPRGSNASTVSSSSSRRPKGGSKRYTTFSLDGACDSQDEHSVPANQISTRTHGPARSLGPARPQGPARSAGPDSAQGPASAQVPATARVPARPQTSSARNVNILGTAPEYLLHQVMVVPDDDQPVVVPMSTPSSGNSRPADRSPHFALPTRAASIRADQTLRRAKVSGTTKLLPNASPHKSLMVKTQGVTIQNGRAAKRQPLPPDWVDAAHDSDSYMSGQLNRRQAIKQTMEGDLGLILDGSSYSSPESKKSPTTKSTPPETPSTGQRGVVQDDLGLAGLKLVDAADVSDDDFHTPLTGSPVKRKRPIKKKRSSYMSPTAATTQRAIDTLGQNVVTPPRMHVHNAGIRVDTDVPNVASTPARVTGSNPEPFTPSPGSAIDDNYEAMISNYRPGAVPASPAELQTGVKSQPDWPSHVDGEWDDEAPVPDSFELPDSPKKVDERVVVAEGLMSLADAGTQRVPGRASGRLARVRAAQAAATPNAPQMKAGSQAFALKVPAGPASPRSQAREEGVRLSNASIAALVERMAASSSTEKSRSSKKINDQNVAPRNPKKSALSKNVKGNAASVPESFEVSDSPAKASATTIESASSTKSASQKTVDERDSPTSAVDDVSAKKAGKQPAVPRGALPSPPKKGAKPVVTLTSPTGEGKSVDSAVASPTSPDAGSSTAQANFPMPLPAVANTRVQRRTSRGEFMGPIIKRLHNNNLCLELQEVPFVQASGDSTNVTRTPNSNVISSPTGNLLSTPRIPRSKSDSNLIEQTPSQSPLGIRGGTSAAIGEALAERTNVSTSMNSKLTKSIVEEAPAHSPLGLRGNTSAAIGKAIATQQTRGPAPRRAPDFQPPHRKASAQGSEATNSSNNKSSDSATNTDGSVQQVTQTTLPSPDEFVTADNLTPTVSKSSSNSAASTKKTPSLRATAPVFTPSQKLPFLDQESVKQATLTPTMANSSPVQQMSTQVHPEQMALANWTPIPAYGFNCDMWMRTDADGYLVKATWGRGPSPDMPDFTETRLALVPDSTGPNGSWLLQLDGGTRVPACFAQGIVLPWPEIRGTDIYELNTVAISPTTDDSSPVTPGSSTQFSIKSTGRRNYGWVGGDGKEIRFYGYGPDAERDPQTPVDYRNCNEKGVITTINLSAWPQKQYAPADAPIAPADMLEDYCLRMMNEYPYQLVKIVEGREGNIVREGIIVPCNKYICNMAHEFTYHEIPTIIMPPGFVSRIKYMNEHKLPRLPCRDMTFGDYDVVEVPGVCSKCHAKSDKVIEQGPGDDGQLAIQLQQFADIEKQKDICDKTIEFNMGADARRIDLEEYAADPNDEEYSRLVKEAMPIKDLLIKGPRTYVTAASRARDANPRYRASRSDRVRYALADYDAQRQTMPFHSTSRRNSSGSVSSEWPILKENGERWDNGGEW